MQIVMGATQNNVVFSISYDISVGMACKRSAVRSRLAPPIKSNTYPWQSHLNLEEQKKDKVKNSKLIYVSVT